MISVDILALQESRMQLPSGWALKEEASELSPAGTSWHVPKRKEAMGQLGTPEIRQIYDEKWVSTDK